MVERDLRAFAEGEMSATDKYVLIIELPDEDYPRYIGPFETWEAAQHYAEGWAAGIILHEGGPDPVLPIGTVSHVVELEAPGKWMRPWREGLVIRRPRATDISGGQT
jgi:hypothetical protein